MSSLRDEIADPADRIIEALNDSVDDCPRCKVCDHQDDAVRAAVQKALAAKDAEVARLTRRADLAEAALTGDNEGIRLWMIDCGNLTEKHRQRAEQAEAALERVRAVARQLRSGITVGVIRQLIADELEAALEPPKETPDA